MSKPLVCLVILNWNRLDLTKRCLSSVRAQTYSQKKIIIVDNGSVDGSAEWLSSQKDIELIRNTRNLGFARAINQGFSAALGTSGKYVIALNNDTEPSRDWIEKLVSFMEARPEIDFAQGASMQMSSPKYFDSTGIYLERGFIPNQRALGKQEPMLKVPAIGPNAAGAIYRREMLENIAIAPGQFFDNRFFAYVEDVDFNLRATLRGHKFAFIGDAKMLHAGSATGNSIAKKKMYWGARNLVWLVYKNASLGVLARTWKIILRSHLANLQFLWREQRANFPPYLEGLITGVVLIPLFAKKRHANLHKQRISDKDFLNLLVPSNPPLSNPLRKVFNLLK